MAPSRGHQGASGARGAKKEEDERDYKNATDAKVLLDMIGKDVYDKAKEDAKNYISDLKGTLSQAPILGESVYTTDTDALVNQYYNLLNGDGKRHPCGKDASGNTNVDRFSVKQQAEYDNKRTKCSYGSNDKGNGGGACAPYRRLSVCNKNMENIKTIDIDNKHDLLLDVCMAAKYEGESLNNYSAQYDTQYPSSVSSFTTCTELARSFADIGDIVRGRDLYRANKKKDKRDKLENNLKTIFGHIYKELKKDKKHTEEAQKRYNDDTEYYYQLREDWWTANRETIWEAMTCSDDLKNYSYFRATCNDTGQGPSQTHNQCRCEGTNIVPTYFDYVPQYLRWFEEWAEDFCRKKNKKIKDAIQKCRGKYQGADRYCDLNGYDCEKTKRGRNKYRWDYKCTGCFLSCSHFRTWIDNQKEQFDKQVKKYAEEINGTSRSSRTRRNVRSNYDNGYEKKFYEKLQSSAYPNVDDFLKKLNEEKACKEVNDKEGTIDFKNVNSGSGGDGSNKTFSHTEYCQACPLCGVEKKNNGSGGNTEWERKEDMDECPPINLYKPKGGAKGTTINFLYSGDETNEIAEKLKKFCLTQSGASGGGGSSDNQDLFQKWTCYQIGELTKDKEGEDDEDYNNEVETSGGLCILKKEKKGVEETNSQKEPHEIQKTFNPFFYYWVVHMLKDSIHWRTKKLDKCINNTNESKACKNNNKCNRECDCFKKWVDQKKEEWENIKKHFKTQNIRGTGGNDNTVVFFLLDHDELLQQVLDKEVLLTSLREAYGNEKDIEHIKKLLNDEEEKNQEEETTVDADNENKTTIDKLLNHELQEAKDCLQKQDNCNKQSPPTDGGSPGRSATISPDTPIRTAVTEEEDGNSSDSDNDSDIEDKDHGVDDNTQGAGEPPAEVTDVKKDDAEKACKIVDDLFQNPSKFSDACEQKYVTGKNYGWKCVTTTTNSDDKGVGSSSGDRSDSAPSRKRRDTTRVSNPTSDSEKGAICIPPRRRRLYVGKLEEWAKTVGDTATQPQDQTPSQSDKLRDAFIQSAAVETFFLWDRYKKEWQHRNKKPEEGALPGARSALLGIGGEIIPTLEGGEKNPEDELKQGKIPEEFKRQMFYTLGDYRDILFGNTEIVEDAVSDSEKNKMKEIQQKIKALFPDSGSNPSSPRDTQTKPSSNDPVSWWNDHAEHIWNGVVCALTYKESDVKNADGTHKIEKNDGVETLLVKLKREIGKEGEYHYEKVELKDESSETQAMKTNDPASGEKTPLDSFVKRPTYFRWLEEWGEEFCKKRTDKLKRIKEECRGKNYGDKYCGGDGHVCSEKDLKHNDMSAELNCPRCYKQCRNYKKWIGKKFEEFQKQQSIYLTEHGKLPKDKYSGDNTCCKEIENQFSAAEFLKALKHCKYSEGDEDKDNEEYEKNNKIDFKNPERTFSPSTYCKTCPVYGVTCNGKGGTCTNINEEAYKKKNGSVQKENDMSATKIDVLVLGHTGNYKHNDIDNACKYTGLLEDTCVQKWNCQKKNGVHECNIKDASKSAESFDSKYFENKISFKILFQSWIIDFIEYYNKSKKKINLCTQKGEKKCDSVKQLLNKKEAEWKIIKKYYEENFQDEGEPIDSRIKSFFEQQLLDMDIKKDKGNHETLDKLKKSLGCNCTESSEKTGGEDGKESDIIYCLLQKLQKKIDKCKDKHENIAESQPSVETHPNCGEKSPRVEDDEEPLEEEENEKKVEAPTFCKIEDKPTEPVVDEGDCEPATTPKVEGDSTSETEEEKKNKEPEAGIPTISTEPATGTSEDQTDKGDTKSKDKTKVKEKNPVHGSQPPLQPTTPASGEKKIKQRQTPRQVPPSILPEMLYISAFPLSVGIAFAALSYFLLKKKTKSSVGNLFQILEIPKGDYGMPTLKSKNRYIPYKSAQYKGKTYIYVEGDSGTDSGYTDHYSDITSSSESEYEEMDINNIYQSPKYKTLIEVVLEPSGKLSGNTIPTSDIPSDNTPTPPPITDDEWNQLKDDFISQYLPNIQEDVPKSDVSKELPLNTHPTTSRHNVEEKPFIMSIHDRNLYTGEEYSYNMINNVGDNDLYSGQNNVYSDIYTTSDNRDSYSGTNGPTSDNHDSLSDNHHPYSGIDLINDTLSGNQPIDIYDELLKRKENELFGTNHPKHTTTNNVAKQTHNDPIVNQINLFHKWLDRHKNMCEQWDKHKKEELLDKLKKEWEQDYNNNSDDIHTSDNNIVSTVNHVFNTDVSIQIDMDDPNPVNQFTNMYTNSDNSTMDNILNGMEKHREPYFYDIYEDDITYFDIDDEKTPMGDIYVDHNNVNSNNMDVPNKVHIEMNIVNNKKEIFEEEYPISDIWNI